MTLERFSMPDPRRLSDADLADELRRLAALNRISGCVHTADAVAFYRSKADRKRLSKSGMRLLENRGGD